MFSSELVNDQFKNLKNNINNELDNIIEVEDDSEYIEEEEFIKPNIKDHPFNMQLNQLKYGNIEDINKEGLTKLIRQNSEIICDDSIDQKEQVIGYISQNEKTRKDENTYEVDKKVDNAFLHRIWLIQN
jgi:hypothetical protein